MNEKVDPEEVEAIMSRIKIEAVKIVEKHGGIVNQFVGDEVVALFGIPTAHEDDPVRAVRAALELHDVVRGISPEVEEKIGHRLRMHTGINTGLIVTNLRDDRDGRFGVTGDTVNTGARLKAAAEDDQVLVSPETQRLIGPFFQSAALAAVEMKGKAATVAPYRIVGETSIRTKLEAAQQRGFTPHAGRELELSTLQRALDKAKLGQGQFVTVVGEAGLGKSRLVYEFCRRIDTDEVTVLEGRCQSYGEAMPYLPWLDALRRGLRLRDEDSPAQRLETAIENIRAIDPSLEQYIPHFLHLLSIPGEAYPLPTGVEGAELKRAFEEALAAILTLNTRHRPMVCIMEDWHWSDESSGATLHQLLGLIPSYPLMVVVLYRPEYEARWGNLDHHTPLVLKALDSRPTETIIKSVLGAASLPEGLASLIHARTDGNPFFIEEICGAIKEEGTVNISGGQAVLTHPLEELRLPDTVQAVIRSRLDRLDRDAREALRLASVIGREFARRILEAIHSAPAGLTAILEDLKTLELIQQIRVLPEAQHIFKHVITQQVTYETLLLRQRRNLHGLVGQAIEAVYGEHLEEHYETLAHHYSQSDNKDRAIHFLEQAGDKASRMFSMPQARQYFWDAIGIVDSLDVTADRMNRYIALSLKLAPAAYYDATLNHLKVLENARAYARTLEDASGEVRLTYWIGRIHYIIGQMGSALDEFGRAHKMAQAQDDHRLLAYSVNLVGRCHVYTGDFATGIRTLEEGVAMLEPLGNLVELAFSQSMLARMYGLTGNFKKSFSLYDVALQTVRTEWNPEREANILWALGMIKSLHGDWEEGIALGHSGSEYARSVGNRRSLGWALTVEGYATFMGKDQTTGMELMIEGLREYHSVEGIPFLFHEAWMAEVFALANKPKEAVELCQKIRELKTESGQGSGDIHMHRALAITTAQKSRPAWDKVDRQMQTAIQVAIDCGARPDRAITHYRYAELLHKKGDPAAAHEQLDQATALFREMEMNWWLEQAEELGKGLGAD